EQVGSNRPTDLVPLHPAMSKDTQGERNQYAHIVNGSNSCKSVSIKALEIKSGTLVLPILVIVFESALIFILAVANSE
ncbi:MAG TPA: hypothetical protein VEM15_05830, partial [Thermodesulfobacteriota bacterium]|nr:hypothetical protein [Thermodesulfobacteriota bacterium]